MPVGLHVLAGRRNGRQGLNAFLILLAPLARGRIGHRRHHGAVVHAEILGRGPVCVRRSAPCHRRWRRSARRPVRCGRMPRSPNCRQSLPLLRANGRVTVELDRAGRRARPPQQGLRALDDHQMVEVPLRGGFLHRTAIHFHATLTRSAVVLSSIAVALSRISCATR